MDADRPTEGQTTDDGPTERDRMGGREGWMEYMYSDCLIG